MLEIVILFGVALVCYVAGILHGWHARERKLLREMVEEVRENVKQENQNVIRITIEKHNGRFFVYGKDDNVFMALGDTIEELEEALSTRYPGKRFAAHEDNLLEMGIKL